MPITINGSGTITGLSAGGLPDATVTQADLAAGVAGTGPAFSAYNNSGTSVSSQTWTKIPLQVENFDTANCFDNATNYRFTPNVAGYYQVTAQVTFPSTTGISWCLSGIYKNGSVYQYGPTLSGTGNGAQPTVSTLMYLNGSTDYIELWVYVLSTSGAQPVSTYANGTTMTAALVRSA